MISNSRIQYLREFARKIATDYGISDQREINQVVSNILGMYNPDFPLAVGYTDVKANSYQYRHNIRMAYIDLLSYFIHLKYIEDQLVLAEDSSRKVYNQVKQKLDTVRQRLNISDNDTFYREEFLQNSDKTMNNTLVTNQTLSLLPIQSDRASEVEDIKITVLPQATKHIVHNYLGDPTRLLQSGIGSGLWSASVYTDNKPDFLWNDDVLAETIVTTNKTAPVAVNGVLAVIDVTMKREITVNTISMDFLAPTRVVRVYYKNNKVWTALHEDNGLLLQSDALFGVEFNNIIQDISATSFRFVVACETPQSGTNSVEVINHTDFGRLADIALNGNLNTFNPSKTRTFKYHYMMGLYNIKLKSNTYNKSGSIISKTYSTNRGAITSVELKQCDQVSSPGSYGQKFYVNGLVDGRVIQRMPILPEGSLDVFEILPVQRITDGGNLVIKPTFYAHGNIQIDGVTNYAKDRNSNTIVLVDSNKTTKDTCKVQYTTTPLNAIMYEADGRISATPDPKVQYTIRYGNPNQAGFATTPVHNARFPITETKTETIESDDSGMLVLSSCPYFDYEAYDWSNNDMSGSITVKILKDGNTLDAVDITNYEDALRQPLFTPFEATGTPEFIVKRNKIYLNLTQFTEATVTYLTKAEAVTLEIGMFTDDASKSGIVNAYELITHVQ